MISDPISDDIPPQLKIFNISLIPVKLTFRPYISDDIPSQIKNFEYVYPRSKAFLQSRLKLERCKPLLAARHPT